MDRSGRTSPRVRGVGEDSTAATRILRHALTPAERTLWQALRRNALNGLHFRRQYAVGRYICDFSCPKVKVIVEVDGPIHDDRREYDDLRTAQLHAFGWTVVRFRNEEVLNSLDAVLMRIRAVAREQRARDGRSTDYHRPH